MGIFCFLTKAVESRPFSAGTSSIPSTRFSISICRYIFSLDADSSVLQKTTVYLFSLAISSTPRAMVVKNGLVISVRTKAIVFVRLERSCRARALGLDGILSLHQSPCALSAYPPSLWLLSTAETRMKCCFSKRNLHGKTDYGAAFAVVERIFDLILYPCLPWFQTDVIRSNCP